MVGLNKRLCLLCKRTKIFQPKFFCNSCLKKNWTQRLRVLKPILERDYKGYKGVEK